MQIGRELITRYTFFYFFFSLGQRVAARRLINPIGGKRDNSALNIIQSIASDVMDQKNNCDVTALYIFLVILAVLLGV